MCIFTHLMDNKMLKDTQNASKQQVLKICGERYISTNIKKIIH